MEKYQEVTVSTLKHCLMWGMVTKRKNWTKPDQNVFDLVEREIKYMLQKRYKKDKIKRAG